jgi:hypothetical protein
VRGFLALAFAVVIGLRVAGEQPPAADKPCVEKGGANPQLLPVDDAPSKPDFLQYRSRLQMAVERRDVAAVVEASDPDIRLGFADGSEGTKVLRKLLAEQPELWEELRLVLVNGGSFPMPTAFAAPYVYSNWPDRFEAFECVAVIGKNVQLRVAPQRDAQVIASVSYLIVRLIAKSDDNMWAQVELGDGRTGYLWDDFVRSPVNYRAFFNLIDGRWRMTAFVEGD